MNIKHDNNFIRMLMMLRETCSVYRYCKRSLEVGKLVALNVEAKVLAAGFQPEVLYPCTFSQHFCSSTHLSCISTCSYFITLFSLSLGTSVLTVYASDVDGGAFSFSLTSTQFVIDSSNVVRVGATPTPPLDREVN